MIQKGKTSIKRRIHTTCSFSIFTNTFYSKLINSIKLGLIKIINLLAVLTTYSCFHFLRIDDFSKSPREIKKNCVKVDGSSKSTARRAVWLSSRTRGHARYNNSDRLRQFGEGHAIIILPFFFVKNTACARARHQHRCTGSRA